MMQELKVTLGFIQTMRVNLNRSPFCKYVKKDELDAIEVCHPLFDATIVLQGAQLIYFAPKGEENWLWLSKKAQYKEGVPIRGGIPICWPWFGDAKRNPPSVVECIDDKAHDVAHGIARNQLWQLINISERVDSVEFEFSIKKECSQLWCAQVKPFLSIKMYKDRLGVYLKNRNEDSQDASISQALHTYLPTTDIRQSQISGLENTLYVDALNQWLCFKQQGLVKFTRETDRVYRGALPDIHLRTPTYNMHIQNTGSNSAVIWNPWIKKGKCLSQFSDDSYKNMLCIETANVLDDHLKLAPNEEHTLGVLLRRG